jgi:hypothetical protein
MGFAIQLVSPDHPVLGRLASLGLNDGIVSAVGLGMLQAGASAHPLGALSSAGFRRYDAGLALLGEQLTPRGWHRELLEGLEVVVNPARTLAISVNSGDENVGNPLKDPKARFARGATVIRRVAKNREQGDLFRGFAPPVSQEPALQLWMLLHCVRAGQLHLELALPYVIEDDRRTMSYQERLSIGSFGFSDGEVGVTALDVAHQSLPPQSGPVITIVPR